MSDERWTLDDDIDSHLAGLEPGHPTRIAAQFMHGILNGDPTALAESSTIESQWKWPAVAELLGGTSPGLGTLVYADPDSDVTVYIRLVPHAPVARLDSNVRPDDEIWITLVRTDEGRWLVDHVGE